MKKSRQASIIILLYVLLIVNCKISPDDDIIKEMPAITAGEITELTEDIKLNDFIVKPIKEFPAYFVSNNRIMGIPESCQSPEDIELLSITIDIEDSSIEVIHGNFFILSGVIYFSVSYTFPPAEESGEGEEIVKYCKQESGVITYLDTMPDKPAIQRAEGTEGDYTLSVGDYSGQPISIASRYKIVEGENKLDYSEPMMFIDNFIPITGGCLISVQEGRGAERPEGLLFWPEGKRLMDKWKDKGRLWK